MNMSIEDFNAEWLKEARITEQVMDALTDDSLKTAITDQHRTLGQLAWHLVMSIQFMNMLGLQFEGPSREQEIPDSAAEIQASYRRIRHALLDAVKSQWSEEDLQETREFDGELWTNAGFLHFTLMHQTHHCGQMTVLMRQAGLRIPELYGPTYDSWIDRGMDPLV